MCVYTGCLKIRLQRLFGDRGSQEQHFVCVCVCVFVCSNANPLHYYALRVPRKADKWRCVVYFQITHRLGRPHYVWDEYLHSVLEKVKVRVTVSVTVCVV